MVEKGDAFRWRVVKLEGASAECVVKNVGSAKVKNLSILGGRNEL